MFKRSSAAIAHVALALAGSVVAAGAAVAQSETSDAMQSARQTLAKWVETQQLISKEREDWAVGKDVLEQRIALVEGEIATLETRIDESRQGSREADEKQRDLEGEKRALELALDGLNQSVERLEEKTRGLLAVLPAPIRERVDPLARRLPDDAHKSEMALGQRFQNVIGILNEINKFNATITVANELRALPDGSTAEVRTIYLGVGQAWYVTTRGDAAGVGRVTADGWEWDAANELAPQVARVLRILENEDSPAYVPLPVTIR